MKKYSVIFCFLLATVFVGVPSFFAFAAFVKPELSFAIFYPPAFLYLYNAVAIFIPKPRQARSPKHRKKLRFGQDRNLQLLGFTQLGAGAFAGDDVARLF